MKRGAWDHTENEEKMFSPVILTLRPPILVGILMIVAVRAPRLLFYLWYWSLYLYILAVLIKTRAVRRLKQNECDTKESITRTRGRMNLNYFLTLTFFLRDDKCEHLQLYSVRCFMLSPLSFFIFMKCSQKMDLSHLWGRGTWRPNSHPVPQFLPEKQCQRDSWHTGAAERHPEVEGCGKRHLQVQVLLKSPCTKKKTHIITTSIYFSTPAKFDELLC